MGGKGATHLARGGGVSVAVSEDLVITAAEGSHSASARVGSCASRSPGGLIAKCSARSVS